MLVVCLNWFVDVNTLVIACDGSLDYWLSCRTTDGDVIVSGAWAIVDGV